MEIGSQFGCHLFVLVDIGVVVVAVEDLIVDGCDVETVFLVESLAATPIFKGIPDFRQTRIAMLRAETMPDLLTILESVRKRLG